MKKKERKTEADPEKKFDIDKIENLYGFKWTKEFYNGNNIITKIMLLKCSKAEI